MAGNGSGIAPEGAEIVPAEAAPGTVPGGQLGRVLAAAEFAVTAEMAPPRGASIAPLIRKADLVRGWVDAVNITDNARATARLASWAGSLAVLGAGVEPVMQVTCRDRNRIALQSDLLGAAALGVPSVVIMTGDHPRHGDHSDATPVFDLNGQQLIEVARAMRDEGRLMSGRDLTPLPGWLVGAVADPAAPIAALTAKAAAGAEFVQTQYVFDVPAFAAWLARAGELGLLERCRVLAGVGPVMSPRALDQLSRVPGVAIPEAIRNRLEAAGEQSLEAFRQAGQELCAELIAELRAVPGLSGIHVFASGHEGTIPAILTRAGLGRRPAGVAGGGAPRAD